MYVNHNTVDGACGVGVISEFQSGDDGWADDDPLDMNQGGAGWLCAGFINSDECQEVYAQLLDKYKLVFRTPTRINVNSGNEFFFAVFDTSESDVPTGMYSKLSYSEGLKNQMTRQQKAWEF